ncbi:MAG: hypothetical protein WDZ88_00805 [Candidatus Paceibacterota bacterium]
MTTVDHTHPDNLEKYAFFWSEVRLVIAAFSLIIGGFPVAYKLFGFVPFFARPVNTLLTIAWVISGVSAGYLLYRWNKEGRTVFGGKSRNDLIAFFFLVITGINLGVAGLLGVNLGMKFSLGGNLYAIVGVLYLAVAYYLHKRYKESGGKVFVGTAKSGELNNGSDVTTISEEKPKEETKQNE